jgi:hypothetical protein
MLNSQEKDHGSLLLLPVYLYAGRILLTMQLLRLPRVQQRILIRL